MANCLVTGGAGFIGSHIVDILLCQGHNVLVVDDLSTGKEENVNSQAQLLVMSILDPELNSVLQDNEIEYVFHVAAQVSVQQSIRYPQQDAAINVLGTLNVLEACRQAQVKKIIYSSTAAVYGEPLYLPIDEKHPLQPYSGYGISKLTAERYLHMYQELHGLEYTVLRYSNVYGPRQDTSGEGGVVAIFCNNTLRGKTPVVFGDGEQSRDFIYVEDVAVANILAMEHAHGKTLNISIGEPTTINCLLQSVVDLTGHYVEPQYTEARSGDIRHSYLNSALAAQSMYWSPHIRLYTGLQRMLDSLRQ